MTNRNKKWSKKEEQELIERNKNKLDFSKIAKIHGRTKYAIICRLKKISNKLIEQGKTIKEVSDITGLDREFIERKIDMNKNSIGKVLDLIIKKIDKIEKAVCKDYDEEKNKEEFQEARSNISLYDIDHQTEENSIKIDEILSILKKK